VELIKNRAKEFIQSYKITNKPIYLRQIQEIPRFARNDRVNTNSETAIDVL